MGLRDRRGAHESWARTVDRTARTQPARDAFTKKLELQVDPDGVMDPETRAKAVKNARKAHALAAAEKSVRTRKAKRVAAEKQAFADRQQAILNALQALDKDTGA
jgi:hypothetical protein